MKRLIIEFPIGAPAQHCTVYVGDDTGGKEYLGFIQELLLSSTLNKFRVKLPKAAKDDDMVARTLDAFEQCGFEVEWV